MSLWCGVPRPVSGEAGSSNIHLLLGGLYCSSSSSVRVGGASLFGEDEVLDLVGRTASTWCLLPWASFWPKFFHILTTIFPISEKGCSFVIIIGQDGRRAVLLSWSSGHR